MLRPENGNPNERTGYSQTYHIFRRRFQNKHPEIAEKKTDSPDRDKEIGDSVSLKPFLSDFFAAHPKLSYKTFLGDSAFDSYDNYSMLKNEFHFERACIPMNTRNAKSSNAQFNAHGTPVCPLDGAEFKFLGKSGGKTVPFALSGCVLNLCNAVQSAFAAVTHLVLLLPTENAYTLIRTGTFVFIPVFPEIPFTGIISIGTELSLSALLT